MTRPAIPEPPHSGGCLCGAVRYRLGAVPLAINACHCDDCKKLSGAGGILMVLAEREAFVCEKGALTRYRKRADSGREIDIVRCADCGVRVWHEPRSSPQLVFIAAGTLDDTAWAVATSHIWIEKASPNARFEGDAIAIAGQPAERQILMDAFAKVYGERDGGGGGVR